MKKTMRKLFSFFVVFAMVLSIVQVPDFVSQAADTEITEVNIEVTIPVIDGDATVEYIADYDSYTVTTRTTNWEESNLYEVDIIENTSDYGVTFVVEPKEGYTLAQDATVTVNGSDEGVTLLGGDQYPASILQFICEPKVLGTIDSIDLTGVPEANIGDKATPYNATETAYSVKGVWSVWNLDTKQYDDIDESHTFTAGNIYKLHLEVSMNKGYLLDYDVEFAVNGEEYNDWYGSEKNITADIYAADGAPIKKVIIDETNFPKATIGESYDDTPIKVAVPEGSGYTVEAVWDTSEVNGTGTFEDGEAYYLHVYAYADKGFYMSENVKLYVGDEEEYPQMYESPYASFIVRQSFATEISEVVLNNLPDRKVGEPITSPGSSFDIDVPEGAPYTATGVWYYSDGNIPTETEFEDGKIYELSINIEAEEGYEFADEIIITANDVKYKERKYGHTYTYFGITYSFADLIDKVEITGVTEPKVGETPVVSGLKVPEGANYKIVDAIWYDSDDWNEDFTVFEAGHEYDLEIEIEANDGYEFSSETMIYIDGESASKFMYTDYGYIYKTFSFKDIISKIELIDVPEMQVGKVAETKVTVPDGAPYTAEAEWEVWDENDKYFKDFSGTFEAGKTYLCTIEVEAKTGYGFDYKVTEFYVEGVLNEDGWANGPDGDIELEYSSGLKVIDRVELTIEEPVVGQHTSMKPAITVADDASYSVLYDDYYHEWVLDSDDGVVFVEGYLVADKEYGAGFCLSANEGYMFSEDVVVVVNNIALGEDYIYGAQKDLVGYYFFGVECDHKYTNDSDAICDACGYEREVDTSDDNTEAEPDDTTEAKPDDTTEVKPDDTTEVKPDDTTEVKPDENPETGDGFNLGLILMLMALCGTGVVLSARAKKED